MPELKLYKLKICMDSYKKHLQIFNCLGKLAGKFISNKLPYSKRKNLAKFSYLTPPRD